MHHLVRTSFIAILPLLGAAFFCPATNAAQAHAVATRASPGNLVVGVSWSNFQEERWKRDEAAIKQVLAKYGADYISADAEASNDKQMRDIDALVARGAKAIIVLAWDADAVLPALASRASGEVVDVP